MSEQKKTIDYRFKILYAIAMIMVVCGHTRGGGISILSDWFPYGGFHLALFMFGSGYFYKSSHETHVRRYIFNKVKTLLIPLYIYNVIYGFIVQASRMKGFEIGEDFTFYNVFIAPITDGHQFVYSMGGWFIIPLFMVEIYNILIRKLIKRFMPQLPETLFFVINLVIGFIGNSLACQGYYHGWWLVIVRMFYFVPFYGLGIFYKNCLEKYDKKLPSFWYFASIFAMKFGIVYYYEKMPAYTPSWCKDFTDGPIMPIIIGFLGIALWMRISTILEPVIGKSKWIHLIADNTYSIMMNQFLGFMFVKTCYAVASKFYVGFSDFDWILYKQDIWYYYMPKGIELSLIIYVIFGFVISILIQKAIDKAKLTLSSKHK